MNTPGKALTLEDYFRLALRPWGLKSPMSLRLRAARLAAQMPGKFLEPKYKRQKVYEWEFDKHPISPQAISLICDKLEISFEWLVDGYELDLTTKKFPDGTYDLSMQTSPNDFILPLFLQPYHAIVANEVPRTTINRLDISIPFPNEKREANLRSWAWYLANRESAATNPAIEVDQHYTEIGIRPPKYSGGKMIIPVKSDLFELIGKISRVHDDYRVGVPREYVIDEQSNMTGQVMTMFKGTPPKTEQQLLLIPADKIKDPMHFDPDEKLPLLEGFTDRKSRKRERK